jgi:hypothetical protein
MQRGLLTLLLASAFLAASASGAATSSARPLVPRTAYLVASESGRLLVLDRRGKRLRRIPRFTASVQSLALSPNRRSAYVSVYRVDKPSRLYEVSLRTGRRTLLANGISPALSPDRTKLAYVTVTRPVDITYRTALVIRDLRTGSLRNIAFPPGVPFDTPPGLVTTGRQTDVRSRWGMAARPGSWTSRPRRLSIPNPPSRAAATRTLRSFSTGTRSSSSPTAASVAKSSSP